LGEESIDAELDNGSLVKCDCAKDIIEVRAVNHRSNAGWDNKFQPTTENKMLAMYFRFALVENSDSLTCSRRRLINSNHYSTESGTHGIGEVNMKRSFYEINDSRIHLQRNSARELSY